MGGPLRVLHVVVNMNRGGAETLIMNLYRNIDRSKVQFDFLTCKKGVFDKEIEEMGGKIHRIPYVTDVGHRKYIKSLQKFFQENQNYRIVHSHMDKMSGFVLRAAKHADIPVRIAHSHNTSSEGGAGAKLYKWYAGKQVSSAATEMYACSNSAAYWLFKKKAASAHILKNGIEQKKFSFTTSARVKVRSSLLIDKDTLLLGHVGRFSLQKNHMFLLEVFAEYRKRNPDSKLMLVGEGDLKEKITEKVKKLGIENDVLMLGVRSDINELLQAIDVFLFPSFHEGLPVTLIEAQGAGIPCLISDRISEEVDMGIDLIKQLPISPVSISRWLDEIDRTSNGQRKPIPSDPFNEKGYNINHTAANIEKEYLHLGGVGL
ncbi:glycosyltransferase family 1 protein [Halobacillus litoralis]|uniref:glycosyltransferase family 1 protein n=1 Tax=Halobacillus litoralis TaxID=45668 RepID=UPI001CFCF0CE|nr:glycosyltransferase family 1 protein [Halobacillus litoralis]WLR49128.1 glycosyltransferase family 1 protein [Halobacillus litoralis]